MFVSQRWVTIILLEAAGASASVGIPSLDCKRIKCDCCVVCGDVFSAEHVEAVEADVGSLTALWNLAEICVF